MKEGSREGRKEEQEGERRKTGRDQNRLFMSGRRSASGSAQALGTRPLPFSHYRKRPAKMRNYHRRGWILGLIVLNQSSGAGTQVISRWR